MDTPYIAHLEPTPLPWDRALPSHQQPHHSSLPRTFLDAMSVREQVYVQEQGIPQSNEFDSDDARSAHWVIYDAPAAANETVAAAARPSASTAGGAATATSETGGLVPVGTIRLVPFPHPPHPRDGGVYVDGELVDDAGDGQPEPRAAAATATSNATDHGAATAPTGQPPFPADRPTTFHDGTEPYIKLGRLAVIPAFRGRGIAGQLIRAALSWIAERPSYFDPNPETPRVDQSGTPPRWQGLVCVHAQEDAVKVWAKSGFVVDEGMGRWMEEGIPHVGMFLRVPLAGDGRGNGEAKQG
ncbi:hypothetical protein VTK26DRAFT_5042 [Humicola hyalothermophila]